MIKKPKTIQFHTSVRSHSTLIQLVRSNPERCADRFCEFNICMLGIPS